MVNYNVNFQISNILKIITKRSALDFLMKLFHILFDYVQFRWPGWTSTALELLDKALSIGTLIVSQGCSIM